MPQAIPVPPLTDAERATVAANLGLIDFTLNLLDIPVWEREDRWQDGAFGLMRAVQMHDPARGKLSTVAVTSIRRAIERGRGNDRGHGYRAAHWHGSIDDFDIPLSLDFVDILTNTPFGELLEAPPVPVESDALERCEVLGLTDEHVTLMTMSLDDAANALGISYNAVVHRRKRLRRRFAA